MAGRANRGAAEYAALADALNDHTPACTGDARFILEPQEIPAQELEHLRLTICNPCPLRDLCHAYAAAARPPAGIWAGRTYKPHGKRKETP